MDRSTTRKHVLKRLLTGPLVLVPGALGVATVGLSTVAGGASGFFMFMGLSGLVVSGLAACYALTFRLEPETRRVMEEFIERQEQNKAEVYDRLRVRLREAGDEQATTQIDRLERLADRVMRGRAGKGFQIPLEMIEMVSSLHDACLISLRRSAQILETMTELTTEEVRSEMVEKRRKLDDEVERSIGQLSLALDRMQTSTFRSEDAGELARVRDELEAGLETARRVDDRIARIERELGQRFDGLDTVGARS